MKTKQERNNKQAVSLIVLIITIIVMIILAGTIILSLNNSGIIDQAQNAVDVTNLKEVQTLAQIKWAEAYMEGNTTREKLKQEVIKKLDEEDIDLSRYKIIVTSEGVKVSLTTPVPTAWEENVIEIVDTVPIPKGFVASAATGEDTKNGGLVIYEGTEEVTDDNVEDAKRTRNQFVWVPVEDFEKDFVRQRYGNQNAISNTLGTGYWEVVLDVNTNMPLPTQDSAYMTTTDSTAGPSNTLAEVQAMYASVKEYKGFYIARYETGLDVGTQNTGIGGIYIREDVHIKMNMAPYVNEVWSNMAEMNKDVNGAVEVARSIYRDTNKDYGVVSTLTYGVQWDRTLAWWVETNAQNGTKDVTISSEDSLKNSTLYGNYKDNVIPNSTFNTGASVSQNSGSTYTAIDSTYSKAANQNHLLTTGATEEARVNNIYDIAGNVWEWTMEGYSSKYRIARGGSSGNDGATRPTSYRVQTFTPEIGSPALGFRPSLYIKK